MRSDRLFDDIDVSSDMSEVRRQVGFVAAVQVVRLVLYAATNAVLPFLIPPAAFGLLVLVSVPVAVATLFGDFGIGESIVRTKKLTRELASLLFWIALGLALLSAGFIVGTVPLFEAWYETDGLLGISIAFSVLVLLRVLGNQYRALLRRQLRLRSMNKIELVTSISSNSATLSLAFLGVGVVSLPIGMAFGAAVDLLGCMIATAWIPGRPAPLSSGRAALRFGAGLGLSGAIHVCGIALANLLLGRYMAEDQLGLFDRAQALTRGVIERIQSIGGRVIYPLLARRHSGEGETESVGRPLFNAALATWTPAVLLVAVVIGPIVEHLYGPGWGDLGRMIAWLVAGFALWLPGLVLTQAILAHGRTRWLLAVNALQLVVRTGAAVTAILLEGMLPFAIFLAALSFGLEVWKVVWIPSMIRWKIRTGRPNAVRTGVVASLPALMFVLPTALGLPHAVGILAGIVCLALIVWSWVRSPRSAEVRSLLAS